jgi:hypothetical protein
MKDPRERSIQGDSKLKYEEGRKKVSRGRNVTGMVIAVCYVALAIAGGWQTVATIFRDEILRASSSDALRMTWLD